MSRTFYARDGGQRPTSDVRDCGFPLFTPPSPNRRFEARGGVMKPQFLVCVSTLLMLRGLAWPLGADDTEPRPATLVGGDPPVHQVGPATATETGNGAKPDAGPPARLTPWPANLQADPAFRIFLEEMWRSSPTFRRQCARLAAESRLRVTVLAENGPRTRRPTDARTVLSSQDGSFTIARMYLQPSLEAVERIAHEFEHILEWVDGVDFRAQAGKGAVWEHGNGAFETRRAIEAGRRVASETRHRPQADATHRRVPENSFVRLTALRQQDRNPDPFSGRSARVSGNGRHVVFSSAARLVASDRNDLRDIYVQDLASGELTLESLGYAGEPGDGDSETPDISRDGRYVVFRSAARNLTGTPLPPGISHVFLRDRGQGTTRLVTVNAHGEPGNGLSGNPAINADGTIVVFESSATNLLGAASRSPHVLHVYLLKLDSHTFRRLDLASDHAPQDRQSVSPAISADGRFVVFMSRADLTCAPAGCIREPPDKNDIADIYLHDAHAGTTRRVTRSYDGRESDAPSYRPAVSGDGRFVAFVSEASNLVRGVSGGIAQVYVSDIARGTTELASRTPKGRSGNGASIDPALSFDGARVAFQSLASDLLCDRQCRSGQTDINLLWDVFVHERATRRTIRASTDDSGEWMESSRAPSLDDLGCVLSFTSRHPIDERDTAHDQDIFVQVLSSDSQEGRACGRLSD